ncbi:MAG: 2OG-Fe(II) oxygenase [Woeseiaceae bacterium]
MSAYTKIFCQSCYEKNNEIAITFDTLTANDFLEETHFFHGRYENIYIKENTIPALLPVITTAIEHAAAILKRDKNSLRYGFWLNSMKSGHVTTAHTHDDDDEQLSCVYYIKVPEDSGDLVIIDENNRTNIKPEEGTFIYFSPDTLHEVTENKSNQSRLSIAFNFGLKQ